MRRSGASGLLLLSLWATIATGGSGPRAQVGASADGTPLCGIEEPPPASTATPDDGVLRVATFNLLHSDTNEGDQSLGARLPLAVAAAVASGADILGAQEVTRNLTFDATNEYPQKHGLVVQRFAAAVAAATGQPWSWCWSLSNPHVPLTPDVNVGGGNPLDDQAAARGNLPDPGDFSEGLAILTRFEIDASRFRRLPPRSYEAVACLDGNPRCPLDATFDSRQVLWARVATPKGPADMFTTHLAHHVTDLSDTTKLLQARLVADITQEWATDDALPDFLVGDFNSTPKSAVHTELKQRGFIDSYAAAGGPECDAPGATGCSSGPLPGEESYTNAPTRPMSERIDYVWLRPPSTCRLAVPNSALIGDSPTPVADGRYLWASDHYGFASSVVCGTDVNAAETTRELTERSAPPVATLPATGGGEPLRLGAALVVAVLLARRLARRFNESGGV